MTRACRVTVPPTQVSDEGLAFKEVAVVLAEALAIEAELNMVAPATKSTSTAPMDITPVSLRIVPLMEGAPALDILPRSFRPVGGNVAVMGRRATPRPAEAAVVSRLQALQLGPGGRWPSGSPPRCHGLRWNKGTPRGLRSRSTQLARGRLCPEG